MNRLAICLLPIALFSPGTWAAKPIPEAPRAWVLDEPGILSPGAKGGLARLLAEHERITGEQVVFAVFNTLDGEDLVDYTTRVFQTWKIGRKPKDNGVLLALYWQDHKARIEVGYGLEPLLTDARSKQVLDDALIPYLKENQPDRALQASALEILAAVESPLISEGRAQTLLNTGSQPTYQSARRGRISESWKIMLILALIVLINVLNRLWNPDAVYTGSGWTRARRGGGGFGGLGGGGFGGGGGRSGGGGASGSW